MSDQPDQPPRKSFSENAQEMRRELYDVLQHHEIYARNAREILERPACTVGHIKRIVDRTAEYMEVIASVRILIDQWTYEPLAEVGLDLPLGRMTGDTHRG